MNTVWATWCPPCLKSIPHLTVVQHKYKDQKVTVIGILRICILSSHKGTASNPERFAVFRNIAEPERIPDSSLDLNTPYFNLIALIVLLHFPQPSLSSLRIIGNGLGIPSTFLVLGPHPVCMIFPYAHRATNPTATRTVLVQNYLLSSQRLGDDVPHGGVADRTETCG